MAGQKVEMVFTAQEAQAVNAIMNIIRAQSGMEKKFSDMQRAGGRAGQGISKGWQNVNVDIGKAALAMGGLATATQGFFSLIQMVSDELNNIVARQQESLKSNITLGQAVFQLTMGLQRIGATPQQVQSLLVSPKSKLDFAERAEIMDAAASAVETKKDTLRALDIYRTAVEDFSQYTQYELTQLVAAASRVAAQTNRVLAPGERAGAGEMMTTAMIVQATPGLQQNKPEAFRNITAPLVAMAELGMDPRQTMLMLAALSQASGDVTLEQSRTALYKAIMQANQAAQSLGSSAKGMEALAVITADNPKAFRARAQMLQGYLNKEMLALSEKHGIPAEVIRQRYSGRKIPGLPDDLNSEVKVLQAMASFFQGANVKQGEYSARSAYERMDRGPDRIPTFEEAGRRAEEFQRKFNETQSGFLYSLDAAQKSSQMLENVLNERGATTANMREIIRSRMGAYGGMAGELFPASSGWMRSMQFWAAATLTGASIEKQIGWTADSLWKLATAVAKRDMGPAEWTAARKSGDVEAARIAFLERVLASGALEKDRKDAVTSLVEEMKSLRELRTLSQTMKDAELLPKATGLDSAGQDQINGASARQRVGIDDALKSYNWLMGSERSVFPGPRPRLGDSITEKIKARRQEDQGTSQTEQGKRTTVPQDGNVDKVLQSIEMNTRKTAEAISSAMQRPTPPVPSRFEVPIPSDPRTP